MLGISEYTIFIWTLAIMPLQAIHIISSVVFNLYFFFSHLISYIYINRYIYSSLGSGNLCRCASHKKKWNEKGNEN